MSIHNLVSGTALALLALACTTVRPADEQLTSSHRLRGPLELAIAHDGFSGLGGQRCVIQPDGSFEVQGIRAGKTAPSSEAGGRLDSAAQQRLDAAIQEDPPEGLPIASTERTVNAALVEISYLDVRHQLWVPRMGTEPLQSVADTYGWTPDDPRRRILRLGQRLRELCIGFKY